MTHLYISLKSANRFKIIAIHLILIFIFINLYNQDNSSGLIPEDDRIIVNIEDYGNLASIDPIMIDGNGILDLYAQNNNLTGNGTQEFPYIIDSVFIDGSNTDYTISLTRVTRHLTVKSSYLLGGRINSILTQEVANLNINNNTIDRTAIGSRYDCCANEGIKLERSANVTIEQNLIWDTRVGIQTSTGVGSILIPYFGNYRIYNNTIHDTHNGIVIGDLGQNTEIYRGSLIQHNYVSDATSNGIYLQGGAHGNTVFGNLLDTTSMVVYSSNNNISYNKVFGGWAGIHLGRNLLNNSITNNTLHGILLFQDNIPANSNNTIQFNNFHGSVDYRMSSYNNTFDKNYYANHALTDSNSDGFTDSPYTIVYGTIVDVSPLANPNQNSFDILDLKFRPYPIYEKTTTTYLPPSSSSPKSTDTTIVSTTSTLTTEFVTVTKTSIRQHEETITSTSPRVGNSNQFIFVMLSLFTVMGLRKSKYFN